MPSQSSPEATANMAFFTPQPASACQGSGETISADVRAVPVLHQDHMIVIRLLETKSESRGFMDLTAVIDLWGGIWVQRGTSCSPDEGYSCEECG